MRTLRDQCPVAISSIAILALGLSPAIARAPAPQTVKPAGQTDAVANDPDDPAIWVHPTDPEKSLILGTNKVRATEGGSLYVFALNGKTKQVIGDLDRPNNMDVEYGLRLKDGQSIDIAVVTERERGKIRIFAIRSDGSGLKEIGHGIPVFAGEKPISHASPMGIALYKRPQDGAIFAIVGRKSGPRQGYLWQYRLEDNGHGGIKGTKVRAFGNFSGIGDSELEAIAVDDALGYVYYADESFGIRKWAANPDSPNAKRELAVFGRRGFKGDREGIGIYARPDGTGYVFCTDQIEDDTLFYVYRREGAAGRQVAVLRGGTDDTDGLDVVSVPLGRRFPRGMMAAMTSAPRRFVLFDWRDVEAKLGR